MAWWGAAIQLGSAYLGYSGSKKQASAAKGADPFSKYRQYYGDELKSLMQNPTDFLENPLYRSALDAGTQATMRGMSGEIGSGNYALGLQKFAMGDSWNMLREHERFLAQLAGADIGPEASIMGMKNSQDSLMGAMGQLGGWWGTYGGKVTSTMGKWFGNSAPAGGSGTNSGTGAW